jgi:hypothetical protein
MDRVMSFNALQQAKEWEKFSMVITSVFLPGTEMFSRADNLVKGRPTLCSGLRAE